jgi:iron complex transport system ATP-binding protein
MNILVKSLSLKAGKFPILSDISTTFDDGKTTVITGSNGSGKSSLLKIIAGLHTPTAGKVYYGEKVLDTFPAKALARIRAIVMQNPPLPSGMRVSELLYLARYAFDTGKTADADAVNRAVADAGCGNFLDRKIETLSGGELRRVYLALALAQEPEILLLDEPEANTDSGFHADFPALLKRLKTQRALTVIMVTHDLDLALKCADKIIGLKSGSITFSADTDAPDLLDTLTTFTGNDHELFRDASGSLRAIARYR